ncbi:Putative Carnitine O-acetyltransferase [Rhizopus microsporus]|nr:Putative Carnitine O-acetyltransferase [Rhizopus microsporus]
MPHTPKTPVDPNAPGPMLRFQSNLPKLPVPDLNETLLKYLKSIRPLLSDEEYRRSEQAVKEFLAPGSFGHELQKRLVARANDPSIVNWMEDWWLDQAYMGYRDPVVVYVSYFFAYKDDKLRRVPAQRAAAITTAALEFKKLIVTKTLEPEYAKGEPMSELHKILTTGKSLDQTITKELGYPDLADLFSTGASDAYTTSFASLKQELVSITDKQFPEQIKSKIDETRCRSFVGILKEIKRAWISLDHCLYLWDYNTGGDICEYVDQDQPITAVGLVKPKPGVFNPKIDYLLIVATALQIIPLGISVSEPTQLGEQSVVNLIAVNLAIPSDDISMRSVVGTAEGRIFMVGNPTGDETNNTGHLYELVYNVPTKWTGPLCQLVCRTENILNRFLPTPLKMKSDSRVKSVVIDSERKVLYILNFDSSRLHWNS